MAAAPFKRINFFKGFLITQQDMSDGERYHVEKRRLHNRSFHAPGVVAGNGDELRVTSRGRGDLSIEIGSGYAIDGSGNDIIVPEKQIKTLNPGDFKLPQTIYVVLRYVEEFTDFIAYRENLDYQGHRRVEEGAKIEFSIVEPDITQEVEIARISLEKGARRIVDARSRQKPEANELDLRYVRRAGTVGNCLDPVLNSRLDGAIQEEKRIQAYLSRVKKIISAQDALHAAMSLEMVLKAAFVDHANVWQLLHIVVCMKWDVVQEVEGRVPDLSAKKEFAAHKKNVDILRGLIAEQRYTDEALDNAITYWLKSSESLDSLVDRIRADEIDVRAMDGATRAGGVLDGTGADGGAVLEGIAFEEIKIRSEPFTDILVVDGKEWVLVDALDVLDTESEAAHDFVIKEATDTYRSRQRARYPDGTRIEDTGIAHEGGFSEYKVLNLTPHQDLVLIRRMDYIKGDYQAEIHVNGQRMDRILSCDGNDRKFRWRNWPYVVPAEYINDDSVTIKQVMLTADRDINMFRYWFYQPK
jgi:hypothetical protein